MPSLLEHKGLQSSRALLHITSSLLLLLSAWLMVHSAEELLLLLPPCCWCQQLNAVSVLLYKQSLSQVWAKIVSYPALLPATRPWKPAWGNPTHIPRVIYVQRHGSLWDSDQVQQDCVDTASLTMII